MPRARLRRAAGRWLLPLALGLTVLNLFVPTSAPLLFTGVPLDTLPALAAFDALLLFALLALAVHVLVRSGVARRRGGSPWFQRITRVALATLLLLGVAELVGRSVARWNVIPACYVLVEASPTDCVFSADKVIDRGSPDVSRWERVLQFDDKLRPWRLGALNSTGLKFSRRGPEQARRKAGTNPFIARYTLEGPALDALASRATGSLPGSLQPPAGTAPESSQQSAGAAQLPLTVEYTGQVEITLWRDDSPTTVRLPFRTTLGREIVVVERPEAVRLQLEYANFDCAPEESVGLDAARCFAAPSFQPLPQRGAVLMVRYADEAGSRPLVTTAAIQDPRLDPLVATLTAGQWLMAAIWGVLAAAALLDSLASHGLRSASQAAGGVIDGASVSGLGLVRNTGRGVLVMGSLAGVTYGLGLLVFRYGQTVREAYDVPYLGLLLGLAVAAAVLTVSARARRTPRQSGSQAALLLFGLPAAVYTTTLLVRLAPVNAVGAYSTGNDQFTYASWARLVLESPRPFLESSTVLSKPFFVYWRALGYLLFGDGTLYYGHVSQLLLLLVPLLAAGWLVLVAARGGALPASAQIVRGPAVVNPSAAGARGGTRRALVFIPAVLATAYLALSTSRYSAPWVPGMSEGPAWFFSTLAMALCVLGPAATHPRPLYAWIGALFGASLLFRTTQAPLIVAIVAILLAVRPRSEWRAVLVGVVPWTVAAVALILAHALFDPNDLGGFQGYLQVNTSLKSQGPSLTSLLRDVPRLVPTIGEALLLVLAGAVGVYWMRASGAPAQTSGFRSRQLPLRRAAALGGTAGFGFLLFIPALAAPYYPRSIMLSYAWLAFMLLIVTSSWLTERNSGATAEESRSNASEHESYPAHAGGSATSRSRYRSASPSAGGSSP